MGRRIYVSDEFAKLFDDTKQNLSAKTGLELKEKEISKIFVMKLSRDPRVIHIRKRKNSPNAKIWIK